jgi:catechol 2,3-dioxygenase-like lactoylglutathione lyase family enzyme
MVHLVSLGVRSIATTRTFYDAALAPLGYACLRAQETWLGYGKEQVKFAFFARASESPVPPDPTSEFHFCFIAPTRKSVEAFYEAALANGGRDNGNPGLRPDNGSNHLAAYVVDPDGYRIDVYFGAEE